MRLKTPDSRTEYFKDREALLQFFLDLDHYLTHNESIPTKDRRILELYSQGITISAICIALNTPRTTTKECIYKYKRLILGLE